MHRSDLLPVTIAAIFVVGCASTQPRSAASTRTRAFPRESEFLLRGIRLRLMVKCLLTVDIRSLRLRLCRRIFLERTYHGSNHDKHGYSQRWLQRRQSAWREGGRRSA